MTTLTQPAAVKSAPPRRTIGFVTACSIVIANIIGTGIFTSLGFQLNDIQSGFALLMLWVIGGIAALCGALCYGELALQCRVPEANTIFSRKIYHPALGFMAGFVSATVGFAAPVALAAMAFGQYFNGVFGTGSPVVLSFVVVWIVTIFHRRKSASRERIPECFDAREIASYRRADRGGLLCSIKTADQFPACPWRQSRDPQRGIRGRAGLRDVFLLRLECVSVYQQRDQAT
jgi:hypothetical protein